MQVIKTYCLFVVFFFLAQYDSKAQEKSHTDRYIEAYTAKDLNSMAVWADSCLKNDPDNYSGYVFKGFNALCKKDLVKAKQYILAAKQLNPLDFTSYAMMSYYQILNENNVEAQKQLEFAFQIRPAEGYLDGVLDDFLHLEHFLNIDLSRWKILAKEWDSKYSNSPGLMSKLYSCGEAWERGQICAGAKSAITAFKKMSPSNPEIEPMTIYFKANLQYNKGKYAMADKSFMDFIKHPVTKMSTMLSYPRATAHYYLSESHQYSYKYNDMYLASNNGLKALNTLGFPTILECNLLHKKILALGHLERKEESLKLAYRLLNKADVLNYHRMEAHANNSIGMYYLNSTISADRLKAYNHIQKASKIAYKLKDKALSSSFAGNYAIASFQQGKKQQAYIISSNAADYYEKVKDYSGAQLIANNQGYMFYINEEYNLAKNMFEKAVGIAEKYRKYLTQAQKLQVMNEHSSAYSGLIMCYKELGEHTKMFEVQDRNRSRNLSESLNKNIRAATVEKVQGNLKEDEVLLYYSELSPGEMVVNVITKNSAKIRHSYPINSWLNLKKNYVNRINKTPNQLNGYVTKINEEIINGNLYAYKDKRQGFSGKDYRQLVSITTELLHSSNAEMETIRNQFLQHWYSHLIKPVQTDIQNKKSIIISVEGALNYLPFEAFLSTNGKYLIETHNVRYVPSATVWLGLQNRAYSQERNTLIAFGGATYQPSGNAKSTVRGMEDIYKIQSSVLSKLSAKSNMKEELKALGFGGANYLAGTLKEVNNLKKIIPNATVKTGDGMKESVFKQLDRTGELAQYKYIHLATHGFALDHIPQLTGVMMTQPNSGDGNEDMFLLAHEIAALNIKADLMVLSACETALGKSYNGEGVNGLNSAILTAGANNSLLSLWPVDDAGTMILMTLVYNNLHVNNLSIEDAVCNAKRELLAGTYGERFKSPNIWAPFVLNGK